MIAERRASGRGLSQRARATTAKIHRKAPVARQHPKARLPQWRGSRGNPGGLRPRGWHPAIRQVVECGVDALADPMSRIDELGC